MFRLPGDRKSQLRLGLVVVLVLLFAAGVWGVARYFDQLSRNAELREAVVGNDIEKAKQLLAAGASADGRIQLGNRGFGSDNRYRPLIHAIDQRNDAMVRLLVEEGAELYFGEPEYYESAVRWALYHCNRSAAEFFVHEVSAFDIQREDVDELLRLSAECGYLELVEYWIEHGAAAAGATNRTGLFLGTPLNEAVMGGHRAVAQVLIERGAPVNAVSSGYPRGTPLAVACDQGRPELVDLLLEMGADPNQLSRGTLPLHHAIWSDNLEAIRLLLAAGADPTLVDADGDSARAVAQREGKAEIIQMFARSER